MRVLQIRGEFSDNGPGTQMLTISESLKSRGHIVEMAASGGLLKEKIESKGFTFNVIPELSRTTRSPLQVWRAIRKLRKVLIDHRIEVVHAHNAATLYIARFASWGLKPKIKLFHSCRGIELRPMYKWRNWIYINYPAYVFAVSDFTKLELEKIGLSSRKIITTYNGVDVERFDYSKKQQYRDEIRSEFNIPIDAIVIGIIGRMGFKGHDELIKAFSKIQNDYENVYALLVGGGPKFDDFVKLSKEYKVNERLIFAHVRFESEKFMAAFDIFTLPSYWGEMFPNVLLEAMSMGNPLISTNLSGIPEIVQSEVGFVIEIKDTYALELRLRELIENEELRFKMGKASRELLMRKFTIDKVVDVIESSYRL